jgi:hypothetical protein
MSATIKTSPHLLFTIIKILIGAYILIAKNKHNKISNIKLYNHIKKTIEL